jgi:hypothetical protein
LKTRLKGLHFADVAEIQEAVTAELKKVQKEEISAAFQKVYDGAKVCVYANGAHFEFKKVYVSLTCLLFVKTSVLNSCTALCMLCFKNHFDFFCYSGNGRFAGAPRLPSWSEPRPYALSCIPFISLGGFFDHVYDSSPSYYLL